MLSIDIETDDTKPLEGSDKMWAAVLVAFLYASQATLAAYLLLWN